MNWQKWKPLLLVGMLHFHSLSQCIRWTIGRIVGRDQSGADRTVPPSMTLPQVDSAVPRRAPPSVRESALGPRWRPAAPPARGAKSPWVSCSSEEDIIYLGILLVALKSFQRHFASAIPALLLLHDATCESKLVMNDNLLMLPASVGRSSA